MHQAMKTVVRFPVDAFAVEADEKRSRTGPVKALVVIEDANLQTGYSSPGTTLG